MPKDKPKRVIMIDTDDNRARTIALMQAYGSGEVKTALVAGEYPVPVVDIETTEINGDPVFTYSLGGTVTGRFSRTHPPYEEVPHAQIPKAAQEALANADLSAIEARIAAQFGIVLPSGEEESRDDASAKWAGIDKRTLSPIDQARRFSDLYGGAPVKLSQHMAQLNASHKHMRDLHEQALKDGFVQGTGAAYDEYTKKETDE